MYKDKHTLNYVQYLNYKGSGHSFHTVSMLYKEGGDHSSSETSDDEAEDCSDSAEDSN